MHYLLKPLIRALRKMNDSELKLTIILGFLLFVAGLLDLYRRAMWRILEIQGFLDIIRHLVQHDQFLKDNFCHFPLHALFIGIDPGMQPSLNVDFPAFA